MKKRKSKKWSLLLIVVIFAVLVTGVYLLDKKQIKEGSGQQTYPSQSTTPNKNGNWKTYTNTTHDFSFAYPASYIYEEKTAPSKLDYPKIEFRMTLNNSISTIEIYIAQNYNGLALNNALGNGPGLSYTDDFLEGKEIKRLKLDGIDAVMVKDIGAGVNGIGADVVMIKGATIYQIILEPSSADSETMDNFSEILSTFSFTK